MFSAKRVLQIGRGVGIRFFSEAKDPGKKSVRELIFERKKELCDFYDQNHPETHKVKDYFSRVVSYAQEQGKMSKKIKLLSPDATLAEAIEAVSSNKMDSDFIEIHITTSDYIDFDGMDPRIKLHEPWHETHPMRLTISVPKEHAEEIVIKLQKHPGIIEIEADLIEELDNQVRYLK